MASSSYLAEDIGPSLVASASVLIVISTVFVGLRYYARHLTHTPFALEDIVIPFAWLAEIGLCVTAIVMVGKAGTGRHLEWVAMRDPTMVSQHFKGLLVTEILHLPAVAAPKLCMALLYLKIFTNKWARAGTWVLIFLVVGTWISYTVATMFQCMPIQFNWDKTIPNGKCFNIYVFGQSSSVPNIVTDVIILILPIQTIMELKISTGRKIGLLLIFFTGSVGIVASIVRVVVFSTTDPIVDVTFTSVELINWTIIEPGMYLLAACATSYKPLFRMVAKFLHLDALMTHSHTIAGRTRSGSKNGTVKSVQADTMDSSYGSLKEPAPVCEGKDEEEKVGFKSVPPFSMTVTEASVMGNDSVESLDVKSVAGSIGKAV